MTTLSATEAEMLTAVDDVAESRDPVQIRQEALGSPHIRRRLASTRRHCTHIRPQVCVSPS
jgi:hypothetical protein